jgi:tetratricopeptide (TPR) repeat protein
MHAVATARDRWLRLLACASLVVAAGAVYSPVAGYEFVIYDDPQVVSEVAPLREGISPGSLSWAFGSVVAANWFPLTLVSYLVDADVHGLSPGGVHITNLLLHLASSVLLFLALLRMTGALWRCAFVAAVFALHPLHVETVAWASERKGALSGCFWMLALFLYAGAAPGAPSARRLAGVALAMALGLLSKSVLVTLPFALLLLDLWPLARLGAPPAPGAAAWERLRRPVLEKLPLVALSAAAVAASFLAQRAGGATVDLSRLPLLPRLGNAAVSYVDYLFSYFLPRGLAVFYPHPGDGLSPWSVAAALALLAALTALAAWQRRARPYLLVGWLWYLGTLLPMIGIVQLGSQARADRYAYIPLIGIGLAATWLVADWLAQRARGLLAAAALAALATLAIATSLQVRHWKDSRTLLGHALAVTERNHVAHMHLAAALEREGDLEGAVRHYREAVRIRPDYVDAMNNLAWLLATQPDPALRDPAEALRLAREASRLTQGTDAGVLDTLGAAYAAQQRYDQAIWSAGRALQIAAARRNAPLAQAIRGRLALYAEKQQAPPDPTVHAK